MRRENDLVKIFPTYLVGEELFGLGEPTVLKIVESVRILLSLLNFFLHLFTVLNHSLLSLTFVYNAFQTHAIKVKHVS